MGGGERGSYQSNGLLLMGKWGEERKGGIISKLSGWMFGCMVVLWRSLVELCGKVVDLWCLVENNCGRRSVELWYDGRIVLVS